MFTMNNSYKLKNIHHLGIYAGLSNIPELMIKFPSISSRVFNPNYMNITAFKHFESSVSIEDLNCKAKR